MIEAGQIVEGIVRRTEDHGLFVQSDGGEELFVDLLEISWTGRGTGKERGLENSRVQVLVGGQDPSSKRWFGSMRKAAPQQNPYLELNLFEGESLRGTIDFEGACSTAVRLDNGAIGWIERTAGAPRLEIGESVDVIVVELDAENGRLTLRPAT